MIIGILTVSALALIVDARFHPHVGRGHGHNVIGVDGPNPRINLLELATKLNLTKFVEVIKKTNVDNTIDHEGPYTLFAPSNAAFDSMPSYATRYDLKDLVKFHVARGDYLESELANEMLIRSLLSKRDVRINIYEKDGGKTRIITANGQFLNQTDFDAHNGVLHIIEGVMAAVYERDGTAYEELPFLPYGTYNVFQRALLGTGLNTILASRGPFTVLAPTDEAFSALPAGVVEQLLKNQTAMAVVLKNHIFQGTTYALGLEDGEDLRNMIGQDISVRLTDTSIKIGGAEVVLPDFSVSNGVIHAIDQVLLPTNLVGDLETVEAEPEVVVVEEIRLYDVQF